MQHAHDMPASPARVLLVEDHDDSLRLLAKLLGLNGYGVETARSAGEAVQVAAAAPIDLVICDLMLPDGCGFELLEELRGLVASGRPDAPHDHTPRPALRGIAVSGMADPATVNRCAAAGFARHLRKPVEMDELLDAVRALLNAGPPGGGNFDAAAYTTR